MAEFKLDTTIALEQFKKRREANKKNFDFNNSRLPAGSPMKYFCRFCGIHLCTLPESHFQTVKTVCQGCKVLIDHGFEQELKNVVS